MRQSSTYIARFELLLSELLNVRCQHAQRLALAQLKLAIQHLTLRTSGIMHLAGWCCYLPASHTFSRSFYAACRSSAAIGSGSCTI